MASVKAFSCVLLLVLFFSVDVEGYNVESGSLCCNSHPKFGKCNTNNDKERCNSWCRDGCSNGKGGFCKPMSHGGQCHCYC
ncbi:PREDICTED: putative defensin-like protein 25 [Camelina sativa]|uniref:Defensin-like protein 25 n=1 Tax=Camelina sativa TaxID=90675 RepID=A0ABM1RFK3_CAMSA|nr:PREDICTED: putative defensin-like protein 25 [Camelina sativa]